MKSHLLKLAAIKLALLLTVSAAGCDCPAPNSADAKEVSAVEVPRGMQEAAYVREPQHKCKFSRYNPPWEMWSSAYHRVVPEAGYKTFYCANDITIFINDDEVQP